jgi:hypothetical protein
VNRTPLGVHLHTRFSLRIVGLSAVGMVSVPMKDYVGLSVKLPGFDDPDSAVSGPYLSTQGLSQATYARRVLESFA